MTPEERRAIINANQPTVSLAHSAQTYFNWEWTGCGFGQLEVFLSKDGTLVVENECMGRDRVRKILHAWADYIADRAMLSDNPEDTPPIDIEAEREALRFAEEEYMKKHGRL
jgi:hypothetical protein